MDMLAKKLSELVGSCIESVSLASMHPTKQSPLSVLIKTDRGGVFCAVDEGLIDAVAPSGCIRVRSPSLSRWPAEVTAATEDTRMFPGDDRVRANLAAVTGRSLGKCQRSARCVCPQHHGACITPELLEEWAGGWGSGSALSTADRDPGDEDRSTSP